MTDVLNREQRSFCMSRIRGKDTKPEVILRKALWASGHRYKIRNNLPGKPDIIFPGKRVAVYVDGCFWHQCPEHYVKPKSNAKFWERKIAGNVARDAKNNRTLNEIGWSVIRIWEHEIKENPLGSVEKIAVCLSHQ